MPRVRLSDLEQEELRLPPSDDKGDELFLLVTLTPEEGRDLEELAARFGIHPRRVLIAGLRALVLASNRGKAR